MLYCSGSSSVLLFWMMSSNQHIIIYFICLVFLKTINLFTPFFPHVLFYISLIKFQCYLIIQYCDSVFSGVAV